MTSPPAPKYVRAAALVRAQVADGTLKPGEAAPSGAQLARLTGFAALAGYSVTTIGGITFHWSDGTDTTLDPPGIPVP